MLADEAFHVLLVADLLALIQLLSSSQLLLDVFPLLLGVRVSVLPDKLPSLLIVSYHVFLLIFNQYAELVYGHILSDDVSVPHAVFVGSVLVRVGHGVLQGIKDLVDEPAAQLLRHVYLLLYRFLPFQFSLNLLHFLVPRFV